MATVLSGNSEAGFIFASMTEFIHLWRSGKEASINIDCKNKQAFLKISCSLGHPDQPHIPVVKQNKKKKKSNIKAARDRARAACYQESQASCHEAHPEPEGGAGRRPEGWPSPPAEGEAGRRPEDRPSLALGTSSTPTTPKRNATSPLESSPKRPVTSQACSAGSGLASIQLPVWDPSRHSPEALREGVQDTSLGDADMTPTFLKRDLSLMELGKDEGSDEDDEDNDKDEHDEDDEDSYEEEHEDDNDDSFGHSDEDEHEDDDDSDWEDLPSEDYDYGKDENEGDENDEHVDRWQIFRKELRMSIDNFNAKLADFNRKEKKIKRRYKVI